MLSSDYLNTHIPNLVIVKLVLVGDTNTLATPASLRVCSSTISPWFSLPIKVKFQLDSSCPELRLI